MIYRKDYIPKTTLNNRRPTLEMIATTITIHNTANESSTAANERAWLTNTQNDRTASFHIVVDENEAIECIPLTEHAWHSGDGSKEGCGNRSSIGIEICESGNYSRTLENAITLVASMLKERGWGVDRLRRHFDWSGKICPRKMYDGGNWTGWLDFKNKVAAEMIKKVESKVDKVTIIANGKHVEDGLLIDGMTYVPLRTVGEALGAKIGWDNKSKTATITK